MSDQPRTSDELFHDVTERRPRGSRATGGTLVVSIVAHALILAVVIVVPLLATDTLPKLTDSIILTPVALPPPDPPAPPITRTASTAQRTQRDVAPVEPHDEILDEQPRAPSVECANCVVDPTAVSAFFGAEGGTGPAVPLPPPPPSPPSKPVRLSAYEMPRKIHDVAPTYPTIARTANVEGVVIIEAVIAVDGTVRDARILRSVPLLDRAALDAVKQWRYAPTRLGGVAVPVIVTVTVQFRLQR
jgi:protein TonB